MSDVFNTVDQLTEVVGQNRMELLLFRLAGKKQRYGINVFKVREVVACPKLTVMPKLNPMVRGVATIRKQNISVIDLADALGCGRQENTDGSYIIIAEYSRSIQGFLVSSVERIVNMNWSSILPPPKGVGKQNYMTAVTKIDGELVEIIDVEKILDVISPSPEVVSDNIVEEAKVINEQQKQQVEEKKAEVNRAELPIMVADDSSVARRQVERSMKAIGYKCILTKNGQEAYDKLCELVSDGSQLRDKVSLIISDVEMPELDGYTLTAKVRANPSMRGIYIILHTSLSGMFNQAMVSKVGADNFIPKFNPDELAKAVQTAIRGS